MDDKENKVLQSLGYLVFIIIILFIMWLVFPLLRETGNTIIDMGNSVGRGFMRAIRNPLVYIGLILIFIYQWRKKKD